MTDRVRAWRWSFRTRLTVALAAIFAVAGAVLVLVQYLILDAVFSSTAVYTTMVTDTGVGAVSTSPGAEVDASRQAVEAAGAVTVDTVATDVLGEMMLWSLVLIAAFALLASVVSRVVVRRAMRRIHQVADTARQITDQDLTRRLDLPGPQDEIKDLGDTIDSMLARLESAFEAQSRFVAHASHELRTPLTATRLALEVPLEQHRVPDEARPIIERALRTTRRSERLVESLLTLARAPGTLSERAEPVALDEIVLAVVDEAGPAARRRGLSLGADAAPAETRGSPELLQQLVENLVDNAIAHNHDGGEVVVALSRARGEVLLTVASTGPTIAADRLERLREPFERGPRVVGEEVPRKRRPGLGLGLSLVDSIAAAHHGRVELEARPAGGLVVRVRLPGA
ncbi:MULTISPECIES: sensor histidine kinase [Cellulomonas]|nr:MULTISPECIES: HAMP domain-containing sensor histidine kinase [Cellulomonas]MBO9556723.1 HAMP domain-containing histidine kinase [Cellulomonas sp.]